MTERHDRPVDDRERLGAWNQWILCLWVVACLIGVLSTALDDQIPQDFYPLTCLSGCGYDTITIYGELVVHDD